MRYYAPWLSRWISNDPAGPIDGPNMYRAFLDNPLEFVDPSGMAAENTDINGTPATEEEIQTLEAPDPLKKSPIGGYTGGEQNWSDYELPWKPIDWDAVFA